MPSSPSAPPHGFLLVTHAHEPQLRRLAWRLARSFPGAPIVVHHDHGQTPLVARDQLPPTLSFVDDWMPTRWGGWSVVEATLRGVRAMLARPDRPRWITHLSGADYPLQPAGRILDDLERGGGDAYLRHLPVDPALPPPPPPADPRRLDVAVAPDGYREAIGRYWRFILDLPLPGGRRVPLFRSLWPPLMRLQAPYGRTLRCHAGASWWTMRDSAAERLLAWHRGHPRLARHLRRRVAPDESYVHTVLLALRDVRVVDEHFRWMDWTAGGAHPREVSAADLPSLLASGRHFARKFAPDAPVLDLLDRHLDAAIGELPATR